MRLCTKCTKCYSSLFKIFCFCFCFLLLSFPCRRILAPGEEENLEFEEDEEGGAGAGPPDSFSARVPGEHLYAAHALLYPAGHVELTWVFSGGEENVSSAFDNHRQSFMARSLLVVV